MRLEQLPKSNMIHTRVHFPENPRERQGIAGHYAADIITRWRPKSRMNHSHVRRVWVSDDRAHLQFTDAFPSACPVVEHTTRAPSLNVAALDKQHRGYVSLATHPSRINLLRAWVAFEDEYPPFAF